MTRDRTLVDTEGWTFTIAGPWRETLRDPARVLALLRAPDAILQENDRGAVYRASLDGRVLILKRAKTHERRRWVRLVSTLRGGEGSRAFGNLERMRTAGLPVPAPVFAADRRVGGRVVESWYAYVRVDGSPCTCADAPAVAAALRAVHAAGWAHGDPHVGNFLRSADGVRILDCVKSEAAASVYARHFDVVLLDKCCPGAARAYPGFSPWHPLYVVARLHSGWYVAWRRVKRVLRGAAGIRRLPELAELLAPADSALSESAGFRLPVSGVIVALNEEARIGRCLNSLRGLVAEIVVVDAGSQDRTREIAEAFGARVEVHSWRGFVAQKNLALSLATQPWALCLDADEVVSHELRATIRGAFLAGDPACDGFAFNRLNAYLGAWVRHTWYPERRLRLVRVGRAAWAGLDPHDRLEVHGRVARLDGHLLHEPYRDLADHVARVVRYARTSAVAYAEAGRQVRWYHLALSPWLAFARQVVVRQGWRDGWRGWVIAATTFMKVAARYAFLFELTQRGGGKPDS